MADVATARAKVISRRGIPVLVIPTEGRILLVVSSVALWATADSSTASRFGMTRMSRPVLRFRRRTRRYDLGSGSEYS